MYFTERIISVCIYLVILFLISYILKLNRINIKVILKIYVIILAILAFIYIPNKGYDLERTYESFDSYYSTMTIDQLQKVLARTYTPTITIFYYFISQTGIYNLAPAIAAFISFTCIFYIFRRTCEKNNISGFKRMIFFIFIMSLGTFLEIISSIRCITAFSIISFCIYTEIYEKKNILYNIPLYLIASTIHLAALTITLIRLALLIFNRKGKKIKNIIIILIVFTIIIRWGERYIEQILFTESYYKAYVEYYYTSEYILMLIATIYIFIVKILHFKSLLEKDEEKELNIISMVVLFIMILNFNEYSMFHRMGTLHFILNIPIMGKYISLAKKTSTYSCMLFVSLIVLFIAATSGNLIGYKFFTLE